MRLLGLMKIFITESENRENRKGERERRENKIIRGWVVGWYSDNFFFFTLGFSPPQPTNSSVLDCMPKELLMVCWSDMFVGLIRIAAVWSILVAATLVAMLDVV